MILNVKAPLCTKLGYGVHSYNYMKSLLNNGFKINYTPIGQIQCNDNSFIKSLNIGFDSKLPTIMIFHENYANQISGNPSIYFPVWECSKIDEYSQLLLNQLDYIFVTSKWAQQNLLDNQIDTKSYIIREGVDPTLYFPSKNKYIDTGKFTFITIGKHEKRKNTDLIIKSFIDTFKDKDCALIVHSFNIFTKKYTSLDLEKEGFTSIEEDKYYKSTYKNCDIYFTKPNIDNLNSLYNSANIGIYPSAAEGWGLPLIETLACGIPCIATNCTGQSEYLDTAEFQELQGILLIQRYQMKLEIANDGIWFKGQKGSWYTFENSILIDKMKYAFENYHRFNNNSISNYIHKNFNWNLTAIKTKEVLNEIIR